MLGSGSVVTGADSAYSKGLAAAQGAEGETMFLCMYTPGSCLGMIVPDWESSLTQGTGSSGHLDCQHLEMVHAPKCFLDDMAGMRNLVTADVAAAVGIEAVDMEPGAAAVALAGTQAADIEFAAVVVEATTAVAGTEAADTGPVAEVAAEATTVAAGTQAADIEFAAVVAAHQPAEADEIG